MITQGPKSLKLLHSIMNLNTISLPWQQARPTNSIACQYTRPVGFYQQHIHLTTYFSGIFRCKFSSTNQFWAVLFHFVGLSHWIQLLEGLPHQNWFHIRRTRCFGESVQTAQIVMDCLFWCSQCGHSRQMYNIGRASMFVMPCCIRNTLPTQNKLNL